MTVKLPLGQLGLGVTKDLCALNHDNPPFSFAACGLPEPSQLPRSYINPKLDTRTYWGPSVGGPS